MLNLRLRSRLRKVVGLVVGLVVVLSGTVLVTAPAAPSAAGDCWQAVETSPGVWEYVNTCAGGGGGNDGGDTGGGGPSCDYQGLFDEFCEGPNACWQNVPAALQGEEYWPSPQPSPESILAYKRCIRPDGSEYDEYFWITPDEVTIEELAIQAFGRLVAPAFTLAFNPPERTYVNLDTWFWADGAGDDPVTGSSAGGLVAIATPDHLEIDPGDGSGTRQCPWSSAESDACSHTYEKASVGGTAVSPAGEPSYPARARLVYTVHFENNGTPIDIPGIPTRFESTWQGAAVPVGEVQAIVVR
jgi:hypothetical protein